MSDPLRILLVDNDPRMLRLLKALLRAFTVHPATDAAQAIALAREQDVDVVVCNQLMREKNGVEILRAIRENHPRAMRLLLSGQVDLRTALGAANESEVFRFVTQPWNNEQLQQWIVEAGAAARKVAPLPHERLGEDRHNQARSQVGVLVIENDTSVQQRLREILQAHYKVNFAGNTEHALRTMQQHEIGVIVSETRAGRGDMIAVLKAIKQCHPHIAMIVISEPDGAESIVELINEAQVFRVLTQPVRMGSCRLSVDLAIDRYWRLKQNPKAAQRFKAAESAQQLPPVMLNRIRSMPGLLLDSVHL